MTGKHDAYTMHYEHSQQYDHPNIED